MRGSAWKRTVERDVASEVNEGSIRLPAYLASNTLREVRPVSRFECDRRTVPTVFIAAGNKAVYIHIIIAVPHPDLYQLPQCGAAPQTTNLRTLSLSFKGQFESRP